MTAQTVYLAVLDWHAEAMDAWTNARDEAELDRTHQAVRLYVNTLAVMEAADPSLTALWVERYGFAPATNPILSEYDGGS